MKLHVFSQVKYSPAWEIKPNCIDYSIENTLLFNAAEALENNLAGNFNVCVSICFRDIRRNPISVTMWFHPDDSFGNLRSQRQNLRPHLELVQNEFVVYIDNLDHFKLVDNNRRSCDVWFHKRHKDIEDESFVSNSNVLLNSLIISEKVYQCHRNWNPKGCFFHVYKDIIYWFFFQYSKNVDEDYFEVITGELKITLKLKKYYIIHIHFVELYEMMFLLRIIQHF